MPDPTNPQTLNRYAYALNNPVNYTDPSGHDPYGCETNTCEAKLLNREFNETDVEIQTLIVSTDPNDRQKAIDLTLQSRPWVNLGNERPIYDSLYGLRNDDNQGNEAGTNPTTKNISIGPLALSAEYERVPITPGWLASTILHEETHVLQIKLGLGLDPSSSDPSIYVLRPVLEIEAYQMELRYADRNGLTSSQRLRTQKMITYYSDQANTAAATWRGAIPMPPDVTLFARGHIHAGMDTP